MKASDQERVAGTGEYSVARIQHLCSMFVTWHNASFLLELRHTFRANYKSLSFVTESLISNSQRAEDIEKPLRKSQATVLVKLGNEAP